MNGSATHRAGRYAAIDIGTVTCRLLVADVDAQGAMSELRRDYAICNLGVGVDKTGHLASEAIERVASTVGRFAGTLADLRVDGPIPVRTCATSASRDADNAAEFKARLAEFGIKPEVIPGEEEAALSFAGATSAFPGETVAVADIGGGSTEIIAGQAGATPAHAHSFNVGCRRVTERFFTQDPPSSDECTRARAWIAEEFGPYLETLRDEGYLQNRLIAVAGTATSIISMREQMEVYDSARVHGASATCADVDDLIARIAPMTLAERQSIVGLDPGRAPVILAGLLIMRQLMETAGLPAFTASERDILHGIILGMAKVRA